MKRNSDAAARAPRGRLGNVLLNLLITLIAGAVYFYVAIPAINLQAGEFYSFVFMLCMIYLLCALVTSGFRGKKGEKPFQRGQLKEYLTFIKQQCLPVGILLIAMVVVIVVGQIVSLPIFRAGAYRDLLTVENGEFTQDISQISFNEIPTLDGTPPTTWGTGRWAPSATWSVSLTTPTAPPRSTTRAGPCGWPPSPTPT